MPDSPAVRQRRYRLHKAGDHSECVLGRCDAVTPPVTRNTGSDQAERTGGLEAPGRELWSAVTGTGTLGAMQKVLLLEACRIVDRLDRLDGELRGRGEWMRLEPTEDDDRTYVVIVDRALSEARQQATALKTIVNEIRQAGRPGKPAGGAAGAGAKGKGLAGLTDIAPYIAGRGGTAG